jgi:hypothetical protein
VVSVVVSVVVMLWPPPSLRALDRSVKVAAGAAVRRFVGKFPERPPIRSWSKRRRSAGIGPRSAGRSRGLGPRERGAVGWESAGCRASKVGCGLRAGGEERWGGGRRGAGRRWSVRLTGRGRGAVGWGSAGCRASRVGCGLRAGARACPPARRAGGWGPLSGPRGARAPGRQGPPAKLRLAAPLSRLSAFGRSLDCPLAVVALTVGPSSGMAR